MPDEFTINLGSSSHDFYFMHFGDPKFIKSPNFKLQDNLLDDEEDIKFIVTDDNGITYRFIEGIQIYPLMQSTLAYPACIQYYISTIEYPNGDTVTFEYLPEKDSRIYQSFSSKIKQRVDYPNNYITENNNVNISENRTLISTITTPNEKIEFQYSVVNQHQLSQVNIRDNQNSLIKQFQFTYDTYYDGRTRLKSINSTNGTESLLVNAFDYNTSLDNETPDINSQDFFGYYNTNTQNHLFPITPSGMTLADREPYLITAVSGILKKITYANGGYVEIGYELNDDVINSHYY